MPRAHSPQGKLEACKNHHHIRGMTQLDLSDEETALLEYRFVLVLFILSSGFLIIVSFARSLLRCIF